MLIVDFWVNKAVVGSGHRDTPKYVGEGVALHVLPGESGRAHGLFYVLFVCFR